MEIFLIEITIFFLSTKYSSANCDRFSCKQGTARLLTACKSQSQALEAAKNLLLGNLRVDMLRYLPSRNNKY